MRLAKKGGMKVYFIGAGPGNPDLLTIKAKDIISRADIIIHAGSLVNQEILKFAKKAASVYDSSKMHLEEVLDVMRKQRDTKKVTARIHSGDPSIYSALQEQLRWCEKEGIPYEIIPGVSSFCSGAAGLKQELTLPGVSQTIIITRISGRTKVPEKENLKALSRIKATLVVFLSVDKIKKVTKHILCGYPKNTPAAIVFRSSWPDERIIRGTLGDIAKKVKQGKVNKQALIYVGDVLRRDNFKKSRLYDKTFSHSYRPR